jgi:hypothetical protein
VTFLARRRSPVALAVVAALVCAFVARPVAAQTVEGTPLPPLVTPPASDGEPVPVRVAISHRRVRLSGGSIKLGVLCRGPKGGRCLGTLTLQSAVGDSRLTAASVYGSADFALPTRQDMRLTIAAPASLRRALAEKHKLIGKVVVKLTQEVGAASTVERRITLVG